ncbi:alpha/beta hydrolase [Exiguobacterium flavidum]|uniref:alpha/beta hydrolase n=1 Tax=Exiguobacterium flavidum TaxID=2184695 RepID=UPI000DF80FB3|nr:alpha/beta fold hydrolase [Exiguobacterium flavidum]
MHNTTYPVIEGAEAFYLAGGPTGILLCHGFNATPQSVRTVGETFAAHGLTVFAPRLHGHGTDCREFEAACFEDWKQSVREGYDLLAARCETVIVAGQSMGATLALALAQEGVPFDGIVTINAALSVPGYQSLGDDCPTHLKEDAPDIKATGVHEIVYDTVPTRAAKKLLALIEQTLPHLSSVDTPALVLYSAVDHVVPPDNSRRLYELLASSNKRCRCLPNSYHVATLDNDQQLIVEETLRFIESLAEELAG